MRKGQGLASRAEFPSILLGTFFSKSGRSQRKKTLLSHQKHSGFFIASPLRGGYPGEIDAFRDRFCQKKVPQRVGIVSPSDHTPAPTHDVDRWIAAARLGSADALGQILTYCRPYLLTVAQDQLQTDLQAKFGASDLVQDTFLEAQRDFGQFQGGSRDDLLAWLRQILMHNLANISRQYRDTEKRQVQREMALGPAAVKALLEALPDNESSPSAHALRRERDETLQQALAQLPEHERHVIEWRTYELCSFEEIGRRLQRSAEAARKLWARAIERLQQILGPSDDSQ
jgi:RNA polymerase sigma-70 factor (ECF subfamily)